MMLPDIDLMVESDDNNGVVVLERGREEGKKRKCIFSARSARLLGVFFSVTRVDEAGPGSRQYSVIKA